MTRRSRIGLLTAALVALVACSETTTSEVAVDASLATTTESPTTTAAPTTSSTFPPESTTTTSTTTTTTTSSSTTTTMVPAPPAAFVDQPDEERLVRFVTSLPAGDLDVGPDDLFAVLVDGDLVRIPAALTSEPGEPVVLLDLPDPREPVEEGPGPNVVESVAGVSNGALVYTSCCEPVSGNLLTLPSVGVGPVLSGVGWTAALDPTGSRLVVANQFSVKVVDLATGSTLDRPLDPPEWAYRDIAWAGPDRLVLLRSAGGRLLAVGVDPTTLAFTEPVPIAEGAPLESPSFQLAGAREDGLVAIRLRLNGRESLRWLDPISLRVVEGDDVGLPDGTTFVRLGPDGRSSVIVVDGVLRVVRPDGGGGAIAEGVVSAWFVR